MKKRAFGRVAVLVGSVGALTLTWSLPARAQQFLRDRRIQEGPGYQAGDFDIHPGLAAEIGYDSNWFLRSDKSNPHYLNAAPNVSPVGAAVLRITPSLRVTTTPAAQRIEYQGGERKELPALAFDGGASGTYREFFTGDSTLRDQRNMSANADAALTILPGRPWYGAVDANYTRIIQPTVFGNPDLSYNNDIFSAGADLATQPSLGTLDWHFGYRFTGIFFEDSGATGYNNLGHQAYTRGRWRFRPRTALMYDGSLTWHSFTNPERATFALHTSTPARLRFGMEGLVTPRLSLLAMVGYATTFSESLAPNDPTVRQYDSIIGQAEIRFYPTNTMTEAPGRASLLVSNIALGYLRDVQASYLNDFYGTDRGYLRAEYFYAGRFLITLEGGVGAIERPDLFFSSGATGGAPTLMHSAYTDVRADATLFTEYRVLPSVGLNATFSYIENFSNTQLPATPADAAAAPGTGSYYDQSWRRLQAFVGVRWMM